MFEFLSKDSLMQIVSMFKRITKNKDREPLFYRVSFLALFNRVLSHKISKTPKFAEISEFLNEIGQNFVRKVQETPSLAIEAFFSKTIGDCCRIMNGEYRADEDGE